LALGDKVFYYSTKPGQALQGKKRRLLKGTVVKVMSSSVQVQYGTQRTTVRRDDLRVPKCNVAVDKDTESLPAVPFRGRKRRPSESSSLNLQQMEQLEEEEETELLSRATRDGRVMPHKRFLRPQRTTADSTVGKRRKRDLTKNVTLEYPHMAETSTELSLAPEGENTTRILRKRGKLFEVV